MAHYDKESGQIILSVEDEKTFKENHQVLVNKENKDSFANRATRWILTGNPNKNHEI